MKAAAVLRQMITRFANVEDLEHNGVLFKTNVPWWAPKGYLHILHPPAQSELIALRKAQLDIPDSLVNFYSEFNGASLFCGTLSLYGLLPDEYLLNRDDWRCRLPFDLALETSRWRTRFTKQNMFWFASYGYDRSPICLDRESNRVTALEGSNLEVIRAGWDDFDIFMEAEVERLCACFDEFGRTSLSASELVPSARNSQVN